MAQSSGTFNQDATITKSDTVNYDGSTYAANADTKAIPADAIYVGGAGVVVAIFEDGSSGAYTCIAGQTLSLKTIRVNSTSTTASLLRALYQV